VAGYVCSYSTNEWLIGRGTITTRGTLRFVFSLLALYQRSDLPGGVEFFALELVSEQRGILAGRVSHGGDSDQRGSVAICFPNPAASSALMAL
jgi:hypothetical protein